MAAEWVAIDTFVDEDGGMFYEAGGVYDHKPRSGSSRIRKLTDGEHLAVCPRCNRRFAATEDGFEVSTAGENRDLHFDGDADAPSICLNYPQQRRFKVVKGGV